MLPFRYIQNLCLLSFLLLHFALMGQDIVYDLSKKEISLDESFFISVKIKNKTLDKPIVFPEIPGTTRNQLFTRPLSGAGGTAYIQTYLPDKVGQINIPSFALWANGKKYTSPIFNLIIHQSISGKTEKNYMPTDFEPQLVLETSPSQAYIGEQIRTQIALYVPQSQEGNYEIPVQTIYELQKQARQATCWTEEVKVPNFSQKDTSIAGKKYIRHLLYHAYLFPLDTGKIAWESLFLRLKRKYVSDDAPNAKDVQSPRITFRWDTVRSQKHEIRVKALPPTELLNAHSVGDWVMTTEISDRESFTGDAITLKVAIQGAGNVALIPKPIINFPKELIGDEPLTTTIIQRDSIGISGTKYFIFEWLPTQAGHFELGPIVLYYFNANTQEYDSLRSEVYRLHITGEDKSSQLVGSDREDFYQNAFQKASETHFYELPYPKFWTIFILLFTLSSLAYIWKRAYPK